jgi:F-type H+-transporting ATPase subunit delta
MNTGRISARYAKAIYEYAAAQEEEETVYEEMKCLVKSFQAFPLIKETMENPTVSSLEKEKILATAAGISISRSFSQFLNLLRANHRETFVMHIALMFGDYYRKQKRIVSGKLVTAEPVMAGVIEKMKTLIIAGSDRSVDFEVETDPDLVGGFIIEVDSNLLDASVKSQLNEIRYQLMEMNKNLLN